MKKGIRSVAMVWSGEFFVGDGAKAKMEHSIITVGLSTAKKQKPCKPQQPTGQSRAIIYII